MQQVDGAIRISPSDLVGHVDCHHLTGLDAAVARGEIKRPYVPDPLFEVLLERGLAHEQAYVEHLKAKGRTAVEISGPGVDRARAEATAAAMRDGADVIVQGAFLTGNWGGRTDVLLRVSKPSALGVWSYEVVDTKLSRRTKVGTILQLSIYSALVAGIQQHMPELMHVVTPGTGFALESYRTSSFSAYFRRVRAGFEGFLRQVDEANTYPEPNAHCDQCVWRLRCDARRRQDDHLCLVAGITTAQIGEFRCRDIPTMASLATTRLPLPWKPDRGAVQSYERVREQARIQVEGRSAGRVLYETLRVEPQQGLCLLPDPSAGDVFFDLESDPFVEEGGLEYLFGYAFGEGDERIYRSEWALNRTDEEAVFERFVDFIMARCVQYPDLHIYHYAPYEPSALKRLMGRYATREDEIDRMLRGGLFVDLYQVVRHSIRASVEHYSIKDLEPLFSFTRDTPLEEAGRALAAVQMQLEMGAPGAVTDEFKTAVTGYNRDDCIAAWGLRDWLEGVRAGLIGNGESIPRPPAMPPEPSEELSARQLRIAALIRQLTADVPAEKDARTPDQQARWILAHILDWHRREAKVVWWEKFKLAALKDEGLFEERAGLAGLTYVGRVGGTAKAPVDRYHFPPQENEFRGEEQLYSQGGEKLGAVVDISIENRTVDIKKRKDSADVYPTAVFAHNVIGTEVLADSLARLGEYVARFGWEGDGRFGAARDLLLRVPPRVSGEPLQLSGETPLVSGLRLAPKIAGGVLPIQGPPGTGKTHVGARMICALVRAGKKVGITATSHKVIRNLLDEVIEAALEVGVTVKAVQKAGESEENQEHLRFAQSNEELFRALRSVCQVAAGTAWLWARPEAFEVVDVLFVDEAAQMSLANVLAVSHAAPALVLLGDPSQLEQPTQGTHPDGIGVSALDYVLDGRQTIGPEQGLFLRETWRLHPQICVFTSELFYEGRLTPLPGLERQEIRSSGRLRGAGLRYFPVEHYGNQSSSSEEAQAIQALVAEILSSGTTWINRKGEERPLGLSDILIIAPYNAQVFELQDHIHGVHIGTVDKFQGQEAPIVIYSMTSSSHVDAPRGMNFLYNLNRLNVATSRALCLCVLIAAPALSEPECRTPEQMEMANAFCRYLELASRLSTEID